MTSVTTDISCLIFIGSKRKGCIQWVLQLPSSSAECQDLFSSEQNKHHFFLGFRVSVYVKDSCLVCAVAIYGGRIVQ